MIGQAFGKWVILKQVKADIPVGTKAVHKHFLCRCQCGVEAVIRVDGLRSGRSSQCAECRKSKLRKEDLMKQIGRASCRERV